MYYVTRHQSEIGGCLYGSSRYLYAQTLTLACGEDGIDTEILEIFLYQKMRDRATAWVGGLDWL